MSDQNQSDEKSSDHDPSRVRAFPSLHGPLGGLAPIVYKKCGRSFERSDSRILCVYLLVMNLSVIFIVIMF